MEWNTITLWILLGQPEMADHCSNNWTPKSEKTSQLSMFIRVRATKSNKQLKYTS